MTKHWPTKVLTALSVSLLVACGGGGDPSSTAKTTSAAQTPQGHWRTSTANSSLGVIVFSDNGGTVWAVEETSQGTTVYKASLAPAGGSFAGEGSLVNLTSHNVANTVPVQLSTTGPSSSLSFAVNRQVVTQLDYNGEFNQPTTLADWVGQWTQTQQMGTLGAVNMDWKVNSDGSIMGFRVGNCDYTGNIALRQEARAAVDVVVTEKCLNVAASQYWGYALPERDDAGDVVGHEMILLRGDGQAASLLKFRISHND